MGGRSALRDNAARHANRGALSELLFAATRLRSSQAWIEALNEIGIPCGPIYAMDEVFADPQVRHLGMATPVDHPRLGRIELVAQPIGMSRSTAPISTATPEKGEHSAEILREAGYDEAEIAGFVRDGAV
jgi:formyl-CoA transferase